MPGLQGSFVICNASRYPACPMQFWAGLVLASAGFLVTGRLRIGAGNWIGRRMPAREIWSRFIDFLSDHGASGSLVLFVSAAAVVALLLAVLALWLAFVVPSIEIAWAKSV